MDYVIAGIVSLGLFIYLVYALLRPERFWSVKPLRGASDSIPGSMQGASTESAAFIFTLLASTSPASRRLASAPRRSRQSVNVIH